MQMNLLNANELVTRQFTTLYETQKILQRKDIYNLELSKFIYQYTNSQLPATLNIILHSLQMFIRIIRAN